MTDITAHDFSKALEVIAEQYPTAIPKREVFELAKQCIEMPIQEVVELLRGKNADHRLGAVSILDWKARHKNTSIEEKEAAYHAYIDNHKWIDNWGLVDRAAPYVVGGYLFGKDKTALYDLAKSSNPMERRTAIVSTYYFIRKNEIEETFNIAEILVQDSNEYVQKAVGSWIREAGKKDERRLKHFLDLHAPTMPRICLRYAIEQFDSDTRKHYLGLASQR